MLQQIASKSAGEDWEESSGVTDSSCALSAFYTATVSMRLDILLLPYGKTANSLLLGHQEWAINAAQIRQMVS
jgi:hypothetical protein